MNKLKKAAYAHCQQIVADKIRIAKEAVETARQAAVSEEKSTAGDKYDTARAMSHINEGMFSNQLNEVSKLKKLLDQVVIDKKYSKVESGALVKTTNATYFIVASIGAISVENEKITVISPLSPIGQLMLNKSVKDSFSFNNQNAEIVAID